MISSKLLEIFKKRGETILLLLSLLILFLSFFEFNAPSDVYKEVAKIEKKIHKREQILDKYAQQALNTPANKFLSIKGFPDDMVIYRYNADTLQSWVNQLPIANDDIDFFPFGYTLNYLTGRGVTNTPLAYLSIGEQYVSLGSAWYIVRVYTKGSTILITALLVQTDYQSENKILKSQINPKLARSKSISIVPVTYDESYVVKGIEGTPLFFVILNTPKFSSVSGTVLRWLSIILLVLTLFLRLFRKRAISDFILLTTLLIVVRVFISYLSHVFKPDLAIFSSSLYADFGFSRSLADLLITNLLIFMIISALYVVRKSIEITINGENRVKALITKIFLYTIPSATLIYVFVGLRSLILNSNIELELYNLNNLSGYTFLIYLSYGVLFMGVLFSLELLNPLIRRGRKVTTLLETKPILIYTGILSLMLLLFVTFQGNKKEISRNRVWTTKMSIERDLNMELQLRSIEQYIQNDPVIRLSAEIKDQESIINQLTETYIWTILQKYDLRVTICSPGDFIRLDNYSSNIKCSSYFQNQINDYGILLSNDSRFFFLNNYNGNISYLGVFEYPGFGGNITMFLEFDSKFLKSEKGYEDLLLSNINSDNILMPSDYSYAKYLDGKLTNYGGNFNYPYVLKDSLKLGFSKSRSEGYLHYSNSISEDSSIIISRPTRSIFLYFVSFSYIMFFYSLLIFGILYARKSKLIFKLPLNSFRSKISFLILASLIFALISMGAGSIWYSLSYFKESNRKQMEEKLRSVQNTLSNLSKFADRYNDPNFNNLELLSTMTRVSNNTQTDINLYSPTGKLLRTTQQDLFDNYLEGYRINPTAYNEIVNYNKKQFINLEKIGELEFFSLYAPLFNNNGKLIAILNIPYFSTKSEIWQDASNIIATIINIYLLLLLAAVLGGVALSNSLAKPLAEISRKMELLNVNQHAEHINYSNKDELGILVEAYNKMVDELESSAKQLAQSEREQAWREMARQIAHEIKNPLTPMRLSIQHLVRLKQQDAPVWKEKFDEIAVSLLEQIDILSDAASEFSNFSRFYSEEICEISLKDLIKDQISLFDTRENISIKFNCNLKTTKLLARKSQMTRLLLNLLSNAVQAVEHKSNGTIHITLSKDDQNYRVLIEDSGAGVDEDLTQKLFKPNFTTKSGGTGLGLYICRNIVEQSLGEISYRRSDSLGGACFEVKLPISISA